MRAGRPNALLGGPLNIGGRVDPQIYHPQDSVLANSLLAQQANSDPSTFGHQFSNLGDMDYASQTNLPATHYETSATFDTGYTSPGSKYGSPREDGRLPLSPVGHLSTLDAPMPASFDSQGVSFIARHGPVAASVPSKFGLESPPASLPNKAGAPSNALRSLHDSAFGQDPRFNASNLGSSPLGSGDEGYGRRIMHSQRVGKPKMMSASLPRARANEEWDEGFMFGGEEDFLPTSLHELLVPQEKMRRLSRTEQDEKSFRDNSSGIDTPADPASQVGSPSHASPSRFSALFAKQRREEQNNGASSASAFGHVGSPLRNSSLHLSKSPNLRATSNPVRSGDVSPFLSSPPRQSSMSMISQQLARTRISSKGDASHPEAGGLTNGLHPSSARNQSQPSVSSSHLNRVASSGNISNGRIDEEQGEGVFSMEEEEENHRKRHSVGTWSYQQNPALDHRKRRPMSPQLGPIGTGRTPRVSGAEKVSKEYWT